MIEVWTLICSECNSQNISDMQKYFFKCSSFHTDFYKLKICKWNFSGHITHGVLFWERIPASPEMQIQRIKIWHHIMALLLFQRVLQRQKTSRKLKMQCNKLRDAF